MGNCFIYKEHYALDILYSFILFYIFFILRTFCANLCPEISYKRIKIRSLFATNWSNSLIVNWSNSLMIRTVVLL